MKTTEGREKKKTNSQQRQRHIALQPCLELDLDVEIQPQLQAHRLGLGQAGNHGRPAQPARLRQLLLLLLSVAAAAAPARVDRRDVRGGVVELEQGSGSILVPTSLIHKALIGGARKPKKKKKIT